MNLKVLRLSNTAILPSKAYSGDLGYDLYNDVSTVWIPAGGTRLISTGISCGFPEGFGALIRDRSSVATKRGLFVVAGVIDNGYTGEIKIALYNSTSRQEMVDSGEKIAQMILVETQSFVVEEVTELVSSDDRMGNGFGSTGSN